jgi:hypothetical protein
MAFFEGRSTRHALLSRRKDGLFRPSGARETLLEHFTHSSRSGLRSFARYAGYYAGRAQTFPLFCAPKPQGVIATATLLLFDRGFISYGKAHGQRGAVRGLVPIGPTSGAKSRNWNLRPGGKYCFSSTYVAVPPVSIFVLSTR